jgi:hypothetical protein
LRDAAKIEVVDPELKKSMENAGAKGEGAAGELPDDTSGDAGGNN